MYFKEREGGVEKQVKKEKRVDAYKTLQETVFGISLRERGGTIQKIPVEGEVGVANLAVGNAATFPRLCVTNQVQCCSHLRRFRCRVRR